MDGAQQLQKNPPLQEASLVSFQKGWTRLTFAVEILSALVHYESRAKCYELWTACSLASHKLAAANSGDLIFE